MLKYLFHYKTCILFRWIWFSYISEQIFFCNDTEQLSQTSSNDIRQNVHIHVVFKLSRSNKENTRSPSFLQREKFKIMYVLAVWHTIKKSWTSINDKSLKMYFKFRFFLPRWMALELALFPIYWFRYLTHSFLFLILTFFT